MLWYYNIILKELLVMTLDGTAVDIFHNVGVYQYQESMGTEMLFV